MRIRNKYYTYPVIAQGNDSYEGSKFDSDAEYTFDAHNIQFKLSAELKDDCLLSMVDSGAVKYAHHIECPQTCFRTLHLTDKSKDELTIHESRLNGEVQICSFLMADQDISQYSNPAFGRDYHGFKFDLDRGCVLAIGNQFIVQINKEKEILANTSSIFCIRKNLDPSATELKVSDTEQKIVILVPERMFYQYVNVGSSLLMPVFHAMLIQPALMQVLFDLKSAANSGDLFNYENLRWFKALEKTAKRLKIEFDDKSIAGMNVFEMSQKFLDTPAVKAMNTICSESVDSDD